MCPIAELKTKTKHEAKDSQTSQEKDNYKIKLIT